MKTYTVHRRPFDADSPDGVPPSPWQRRLANPVRRLLSGEPEELVFVKEGISWPAAIFTIAWAIWHRLWIFAICLLAAGLALGTLTNVLDPDPVRDLTLVASFLALVGFFANDARRRSLAATGYEFVGVVQGRSADGAQLRYLDKTSSVMEEARS